MDGRDEPGHDEAGARMAGTRNLPSPNVRNPAKLRIERFVPPSLDFWSLEGMVRATFGKSEPTMRNIITKLLIVVVPRRTAGDG